jgi:hypothetical protein
MVNQLTRAAPTSKSGVIALVCALWAGHNDGDRSLLLKAYPTDGRV